MYPPSASGFKSRDPPNRASLEEREGLLSESDKFEPFDDPFVKEESELSDSDGWSRSKIVKTAIAFIIILVLGAFSRAFLRSPPQHPNLSFNGEYIRSNGTHDFKRTVLIVSIDGLRSEPSCMILQRYTHIPSSSADYLDRGLTPHLLEISKRGLRAKSMVPIFPVSGESLYSNSPSSLRGF